ncbi:phosphoglycolate phosphatase [Salinirubellus sp. GCM10025818]|uniref:phosphoglycolate phosphatase n=1 Tax=Salinirubellus TaxID=2162630 RepID=UPI0030D5D710
MAESPPLPPLAVDIDGTLTDDRRRLDHRVPSLLRKWADAAPVVVATGKALPYPVALCEFLGIPTTVVAENGGAAYVERTDELRFVGDRRAAEAVAEEYAAAGHSLGWGEVDLPNRWRETELAVSREQPLEPLEGIAARHGLEVVDTGFAYHVKSPDVDKAKGLTAVADALGIEVESFAAIGDSANDVGMLERARISYAVANADEAAREAADHVTDGTYGDGFIEAAERIRAGVD